MRASTPLPVPFSPRSRTVESVWAARTMISSAARIFGEWVSRSISGTVCLQLLVEFGQPPFGLPALGELVDQMPNLLGREGLGQIVDRPALQGLDGGFDRGVGRQHDDAQAGAFGQQLGKQVETAGFAQPQIEKHQVERALSRRRPAPRRASRPTRTSQPMLSRQTVSVARIFFSSSMIRTRSMIDSMQRL